MRSSLFLAEGAMLLIATACGRATRRRAPSAGYKARAELLLPARPECQQTIGRASGQ
jgi:hypothetical protein